MTAQQPDNNLVRVSLQALAAILGGAQSLHCNGRDEALALPTEESATIALRTQQILLHESGVAQTADPVGGSHVIEALTDQIEQEAMALLNQIDAAGGTLRAIETGFIQGQIQEAAFRAQQRIDSGDDIVVGVNAFGDAPGEAASRPRIGVFAIDPEVEARQVARVGALRASRGEAWQSALAGVAAAARGTANLVPPVIAAVEQRATLGEIADTLRSVFGEHQDSSRA